jgi:hypothetical protein
LKNIEAGCVSDQNPGKGRRLKLSYHMTKLV